MTKSATNIQVKGQSVQVTPTEPLVNNWLFLAFKNDKGGIERATSEAELANAMAKLCAANGLDANDLKKLFPAVLRMLKSNSDWAK